MGLLTGTESTDRLPHFSSHPLPTRHRLSVTHTQAHTHTHTPSPTSYVIIPWSLPHPIHYFVLLRSAVSTPLPPPSECAYTALLSCPAITPHSFWLVSAISFSGLRVSGLRAFWDIHHTVGGTRGNSQCILHRPNGIISGVHEDSPQRYSHRERQSLLHHVLQDTHTRSPPT
jgi:hypothetical protein